MVARRRAGALLGLAVAAFVAATVAKSQFAWLGWVQAGALAATVGGLADWFAVTALFRRPLGLPIPHTAIVVERKDRFAATIGDFVQESFLTPEAVGERLRHADALGRGARWLADPAHADQLAGRTIEAVAAVASSIADEEVHEALALLIRQRAQGILLAPLVGRALVQVTSDDRHQPLLDAALRGAGRYLEDHSDELHSRLASEAPWWLPTPIETKIIERMLARGQGLLEDMAADRSHPLRVQLDSALDEWAESLQSAPEMIKRGEELKAELLAQPELRSFVASAWADAKRQLRAQAGESGSHLRRRVAQAFSSVGVRLGSDPELAAAASRSIQAAVTTLLGRFDKELSGLVSGTIQRWDASETSRRLELLLGPDLQYIRINGTVVGGLAGLALHALSILLARG